MRRIAVVALVVLAALGVAAALYAGWRATPQYNQTHDSPYRQGSARCLARAAECENARPSAAVNAGRRQAVGSFAEIGVAG
jgi:hypothetical protein